VISKKNLHQSIEEQKLISNDQICQVRILDLISLFCGKLFCAIHFHLSLSLSSSSSFVLVVTLDNAGRLKCKFLEGREG
jgi:hypothetical protein